MECIPFQGFISSQVYTIGMTLRQKCIHCDKLLKRMYVRIDRVFTGVDYYYCSSCGSSFNIRDLVHYDADKVEPTDEVINEVFPVEGKLRDLPKEGTIEPKTAAQIIEEQQPYNIPKHLGNCKECGGVLKPNRKCSLGHVN